MISRSEKALYFLKKALQDLTNPLIYNVNENNINSRLEEYYFTFDYKKLLDGGSYKFSIDERGIPMVAGHIADTDGGVIYNPQAIGQFSLALYGEYVKTKEKKYLKSFLNIADWFMENYKIINGIPYWASNEKTLNKVYGEDDLQKISSMSHSRAISVLLRVYQETNERRYLDLVEDAMKAYTISFEKGSFLDGRKGLIIFEEKGQPRILNHIIFSVFGLYDYCRIKKFNTEYYELFLKSIESIKNILPNYDNGWWSLYDDFYIEGKRRINPCTRHYHYIHINQLKVLYSITKDSYFNDYSLKWRDYDKNYLNRIRMLGKKFFTVKKMNRI